MNPKIDRSTVKSQIRLAVEDSDRYVLRQLEREHKDGAIRAAVRAADNYLVALLNRSAAQIEVLGKTLMEKWEAL